MWSDFGSDISRGFRATGRVASAALLATSLGLTANAAAQPRPAPAPSASQETTLQAQLRTAFSARRFAEARVAAERLLRLYDGKLQPRDPKIGGVVELLALLYGQEKDWPRALEMSRRALTSAEAVYGPDSAQAAEANRRLSGVYVHLRDYERALPHAERTLQLFDEQGARPELVLSILRTLEGIHLERKDYARLDGHYLRSLRIQESLKGVESEEVAHLATGIGRARLLAGNAAGALPYLQRALAFREKSPGPSQAELAASLTDLAEATARLGHPKPALELYRRAAELYAVAPNELELSGCLERISRLSGDAGSYRATAEQIYQTALSRAEQEQGPNTPLVAAILASFAGFYGDTGQRRRAVPLYERALAIREAGNDRAELALALQDLALARQKLGELAAAEAGYARAFRILEESGATEGEDAAQILSNWASLAADRGDLRRAEILGQRALALAEKLFGSEGADTAFPANNLGDYYKELGKLDAAEPLYRRAHAIWTRELGPEHALVGLALNNLGTLYRDRGDYRGARDYLLRALAVTQKAQGSGHSDAALTLNNLASIELARGNYVEAEPLFQQALDILESAHGAQHPLVGMALSNLGIVRYQFGNSQGAEALFQRALAIAAATGDTRAVAKSHLNLALVYDQRNELSRAEPLLLRALALIEASRAEVPELAAVLLGLASVRAARGEPDEAVRLLERARGIAHAMEGEAGPGVARIDASLAHVVREQGRYADAEALYVRAIGALKASGDDHPDLAVLYTNLANLFWELRKRQPAIRAMQQGLDVRERHVSRALSAGSEEQRRLLLSASAPEIDWAIGLHEHGFPGDDAAKRLALLAVLRSKGRLIEVMHDTTRALREHLGPAERQLFDQLKAVRAQLARLAFADGSRSDQLRAELSGLAGQADALEAQIAARSALFRSIAQPVTLEGVAARVPEGAALVEIVAHVRFDPHGGPLSSWHERRYSAYVLERDRSVSYADLGAADAIDTAVAALREALRNPRSDPTTAARALDERVMRPIRRLLGKTRNLILSADGSLSLVPFGALVDERHRYLIDDWSIRYVSTGRELLKPASGPPRTAALVVADPAFDAPSTGTGTGSARRDPVTARPESRAQDAGIGRFDALRGAVEEGRAVARSLGDAGLLSGSAASVNALLQLKGPRVLHLATHGFFLGDEKPVASGHGVGPGTLGLASATIPINPLLRSGLALAGANLRKSEDTGILTALEASSLDLWGTQLVVLSACDTGVGTVTNREGVYGLRRALTLAGAESLVTSLWRVNDAAARDLMTAYYEALANGGNRASSLRDVQLAMRRNERQSHPYYWASFIALGAEGPLGPAPALPPALPGLGAGSRPPAARSLGTPRGCSCDGVSPPRSDLSPAWSGLFLMAALLLQRRSRSRS